MLRIPVVFRCVACVFKRITARLEHRLSNMSNDLTPEALDHATALFAQLHNEQDDWDTDHWETEPTPQPAEVVRQEDAWYYWIDDGFQGPEWNEDELFLLQQLDDAAVKWQQMG